MSLSRRDVLKAFGLSGTGLVLGLHPSLSLATDSLVDQGGNFDPFLHLAEDGQFTFIFPRAEMGQGAIQGLTTLVAEELNLDIESIQVLHAPANNALYMNPLVQGMQITGGSTSMIAHYEPLRQTAADFRATIINAAAMDLGVAANDLNLDQGRIVTASDDYPWQQFIATAAQGDRSTGTPKAPADFKLIGQNSRRLDAMAKATGTAVYGLDIDIENMHRAVVVRCPVIGGAPKTFDAQAALNSPGVIGVYPIFSGVAVVADQLWNARLGASLLEIEWDLPEPLRGIQSAQLPAAFSAAADAEDGLTGHEEGDVESAMAQAKTTLTQDYYAPYLAHATMEPMTATMHLTESSCDIWTGTQAPDAAQALVVSKTDLEPEQVRVHNCMLGGGFGRRAAADVIRELVEVAQAAGVPVQMTWSREDDMRNDYYRPPAFMRMQAGIDETGRLAALDAKRVGPQILGHQMKDMAQILGAEMLPEGAARWLGGTLANFAVDHIEPDPPSLEGLVEDYDCANKRAAQITLDPGLRLGYWRSVGHSYTAFGKESLMDELAEKTQQDPVDFRLAHLTGNSRLRGTLEAVAAAANWHERRAAGAHIGVASHFSFQTAVSEIAEVDVSDGNIRVTKVWCAVDCGYAVNPDVVRAQMESGIVYGLSAALYGDITLVDGAVQEGNFNDYPALRIAEMPEIEVIIVNSADKPLGGVGEPGTPPIAPAVANAIFAATGQRLRSLPLQLS